MKKQTNTPGFRRFPPRWLWVMLLEMICSLAICLLLGLSLWLGGFVHGLCKWVLTPACGLLCACIATRAGFLNYLAFLVPPLMCLAANLILWGYLPHPAPVLVCAFASLVGAAAGEVLKRQHEKQRSKPWKKI